jgi:hypothetical protein
LLLVEAVAAALILLLPQMAEHLILFLLVLYVAEAVVDPVLLLEHIPVMAVVTAALEMVAAALVLVAILGMVEIQIRLLLAKLLVITVQVAVVALVDSMEAMPAVAVA